MIIAALICWLAGFILLWKIPKCTPLPDAGETESISIIIPARNEELSLPKLLSSIRQQQYPLAELLVVDDHSTDRTAEIARDYGARVISPGPLPDDWRGKPWACSAGARTAVGQHLLFVDADTWFEANGLRGMIAVYFSQPGVLSVIPYHRVPTITEQLSAFFNLVMTAGIGAFSALSKRPSGLFGQMLLIDRDIYLAAGGHEVVRDKILENLHLAKILLAKGVSLRCASGRGALSMRMYPSGVRSMVQGWTKGFASGAGATSPIIMALTIAWLSGAVMAFQGVLQARSSAAGVVYALYVGQLYFQLRRVGSFWFVTALLYPIPLLFFFAVFGNSLARSGKSVAWKGRVVRAG